ncbi:MAG: ABC transporter ATP-binding protein, partial [Alphaproteobacteria bacterium]|nr:ABC transporter ATP-binding protein [Alphaproteobacteria bacterium]
MTENVISLIDLRKSFGSFEAIKGINLDLHENEFFALLGPSGCGKTTLLRMIGGFETPTSGQVNLSGKDITALRPNKRPINLMFQSYALFPHMSVEKNIAYGLEMEKCEKAEITRRVGEVIEMAH